MNVLAIKGQGAYLISSTIQQIELLQMTVQLPSPAPWQGEMGINFLFDFAACRGVSKEWHWVAEAMLQEGANNSARGILSSRGNSHYHAIFLNHPILPIIPIIGRLFIPRYPKINVYSYSSKIGINHDPIVMVDPNS